MVCTWYVVKAKNARRACGMAMRVNSARRTGSGWFVPKRCCQAERDEAARRASMGAASRNRGRFDRVQYLRKPTFLLWVSNHNSQSQSRHGRTDQ